MLGRLMEEGLGEQVESREFLVLFDFRKIAVHRLLLVLASCLRLYYLGEMKVHVPSIPEEGKSFPLEDTVPWVRQMLEERMADYWQPGSPVSGELRLWRTNTNVTLHGHWELTLSFVCDRCTATYSTVLSIPLNRHLTPFFDDPRDCSSEERELSEEDLEFSTYHGDEMDLLEILSEEFFLALPMGSYCREDCLGLCTRCGADLNKNACSCSQEPPEDSPFAVLKGWKRPQ